MDLLSFKNHLFLLILIIENYFVSCNNSLHEQDIQLSKRFKQNNLINNTEIFNIDNSKYLFF